ncbi:NUDIX hydrolase [Streptomyces sp. NPDC017936]|uniref:NUDIX hydrolase n=1 Tax=Streptomyces sp. NPDC017936 TaxID=3365016 RepID=UPI00379EB2FE
MAADHHRADAENGDRTDDPAEGAVPHGRAPRRTPESAYAHLRETRPERFRTPPGDGAITIEHGPAAEGRVVHHDRWWTLLQDPVVFPDGRNGRYLRMLSPRPEPGVAVLPLLDGDVVLIEQFRHATRDWHWEIPRGHGTSGLDDKGNVAKEIGEEIGATVSELIELGLLHPDTGILGQAVGLYAARIAAIGELGHGEGIRSARAVSFAEAERMAGDGTITDAFTIAALFRARRAGLAG